MDLIAIRRSLLMGKKKSKNLFDASSVIRRDKFLLDDNGVEQSTVQSGYTLSLTPVEPNTTYTFSGTIAVGTQAWRMYYYSSSKTFLIHTAFSLPFKAAAARFLVI